MTLPPGDAFVSAARNAGSAEEEIGWRRFQGEVTQLQDFIIQSYDSPDATIAFFDGSFILSFLRRLPLRQRLPYLDTIRQLLAAVHPSVEDFPDFGFRVFSID